MEEDKLQKVSAMGDEEVINEFKKIKKELNRVKKKKSYAIQAMKSYEGKLETADGSLAADFQKRYDRVKRDLVELEEKVNAVQMRYDDLEEAYNKIVK